jgi:hypothetical protein
MKLMMRGVLQEQRVESKLAQASVPCTVRRVPLLSLIAAAFLISCAVAGCERKTYSYAGVEAQGAPAATPNPHR